VEPFSNISKNNGIRIYQLFKKSGHMNLKAIKLDNNSYHEYLDGKEIACDASSLNNKNLHEGEHILVYKDTVASGTDVGVPKREMQSEYIGVEGLVTRVQEDHAQVLIKKI
jgi:hypothetical protein